MDAVEVANRALDILGATRITSLERPYASREAELAGQAYGPVVQKVLEVRDWSFAKTRFTLTAEAAPPSFEFDYSYLLPSTVLRVIEVHDPSGTTDAFMASLSDQPAAPLEWIVEANRILVKTTSPTVNVLALQRVDDPAKWTPSFSEAVWTRLAAELCTPLTQDKALTIQLVKLYEVRLAEAAASDGRQGRSQRLRSNWISRRR